MDIHDYFHRDAYKAFKETVAAEKVTLGADPEFAITFKNKLVPANTVLPGGTDWFVGTDGHNATGEMRPRPNADPFKVVASCREGLVAMAPLVKRYHVRGGHWAAGEPLGGHIHLNWPRSIDDKKKDSEEGSDNLWSKTYVGSIDFLNVTFELIRDKLETNCVGMASRLKRGYGKFGARDSWRSADQHGGIEFRPPPSWLVSPSLAAFYLTVAKMSFYDWIMFKRCRSTGMPSTVITHSMTSLNEMLKKPAPHYPEELKERMSQVANVITSEVDWDADILETWEAK